MLKTICKNYFTCWPAVECGIFNSVERWYCCLKKGKSRMIYTATRRTGTRRKKITMTPLTNQSESRIRLLMVVKSATASFNYLKIVKSGAIGISLHLTPQPTNCRTATASVMCRPFLRIEEVLPAFPPLENGFTSTLQSPCPCGHIQRGSHAELPKVRGCGLLWEESWWHRATGLPAE